MPRYVLLHHEMPSGYDRRSHWDFMLEREGVLRTWAMDVLPRLWAEALNLTDDCSSDAVPVQQLADHRLAYLEYEGPLSGDRGIATRLARGDYSVVEQRVNRVEIELAGTLHGFAELNRESGTSDSWVLRVTRGP